ncbi:hypothetical protein QYF61_003236 [Mycteria americana]|uniref:Rna-directed dna polymerase from mobile element jockey-like n=1 Tax=Mycteria americana TaxID=33587 RepID=A0AAN7N0N7_MYCAM|nr:hypothetical protein QYF61_003236 [Mycteria americana]
MAPSCVGTRDRKRLEKWADRHLLLLSKGKCKVLHLGRNSPMHQYMLEANWLESWLAEKDLGILFNKFNMSKQCTLVAKKGKSITSRLRKVILALYSALVRPHLECCV